jgi:proteasome lid subunit RPN8/RPN11
MSSNLSGRGKPLLTPILVKSEHELVWPERERLFYLLARDGLYLCRQNEFFRSCVKASSGPSELELQKPFFEPRFPKIPAALIEQAVGFFTAIADRHGSEAAALLVWDRSQNQVHLVVPAQIATMGGFGSDYRYPIGVHYDSPGELPQDWVVFGDIHSHVDYAAYASHTDVNDELHSAGLHIVVGRIRAEPPDFHVEAVVDGERFVLEPADIVSGYATRCMTFPEHWLERVEIEPYKPVPYSAIYSVN